MERINVYYEISRLLTSSPHLYIRLFGTFWVSKTFEHEGDTAFLMIVVTKTVT